MREGIRACFALITADAAGADVQLLLVQAEPGSLTGGLGEVSASTSTA